MDVPERRVLAMWLNFDGWINGLCRKLWDILEVVYTAVGAWNLNRQHYNKEKLKHSLAART